MINVRKAAVIGCGFVGASIAFSLMQKGIFSELVLIDANREKAEGEAMDLSHGLPYTASMRIYAGDYDDVADCAMVIVTAGANQKPGETRLDLIGRRWAGTNRNGLAGTTSRFSSASRTHGASSATPSQWRWARLSWGSLWRLPLR